MVETVITSYLTGQMTPDIVRAINAPATMGAMTSFILSIVACIFLVAIYCLMISWLKKTDEREVENNKSKVYRSLMTDMYVVGMVKKFAKEEGVNIEDELKAFAKAEKKKDSKGKAIDNIIEDNINEKIDAKTEKELEKIEGK
jgi:hypothetical protein